METNLTELDEKVAHTRACTIAAKSRISYLNSTVRMIAWVVRNKASLAPTEFRNTLQYNRSGDPTKDSVLAALASAPDNPLDFDAVEAQHFLSWILSIKNNKNGG
eukprot:jgi/Phyca11/112755/e_gw1.22.422.1